MTKLPTTVSRDEIIAGIENSRKRVLPAELVQSLKQDVVPIMLAAIETGNAAFDLDPDHNDQQNHSHYIWRNMLNRMKELVSEVWRVTTARNDLRLLAKFGDDDYLLRIHRVHSKTRTPRGGRLAKKAAFEAQWAFLSPELERMFFSFSKGNVIIGYDLDTVNGLGKITVEMLIPTAKKNTPIALTLHTLYGSGVTMAIPAQVGVRPDVERIIVPETRRDVEVPALVRKRKNE